MRNLNPNKPQIISGRKYSGHAIDRMQERGLTPTVIEHIIKNGSKVPDKNPARILHIVE